MSIVKFQQQRNHQHENQLLVHLTCLKRELPQRAAQPQLTKLTLTDLLPLGLITTTGRTVPGLTSPKLEHTLTKIFQRRRNMNTKIPKKNFTSTVRTIFRMLKSLVKPQHVQ